MRRGVAAVTRALVVALLAGAAATTAHAQLPLDVEDVRLVEQSAGNWTFNTPGIRVSLPGPPSANVTVNWNLVAGSATAGTDFIVAGGSLTFSALVESVEYINIAQIVGDTMDEWSPTLKQDEVFFVELSNPSANAYLRKGRGTVTLIDDDRSMTGVQFLSAVSGGTASTGMNKLQWRIPGSSAPITNITVAWKPGSPNCGFPTSTTDTAGGGSFSVGIVASPGSAQTWTHPSAPPNTTFCYSVFAMYPAPVSGPEIANVKTRTFDATGIVAWTYATGSTNVVPPSVGQDAIYTVDSQGVLHAMLRGPSGGAWPTTPLWHPVSLGKPTQNRSAVVPIGGGNRLLLGTDGGGLHSVDAKSGSIVWSLSSSFGTALPTSGGVQAQPAALLKDYGGNNDMILVGTNTVSTNKFFALNPLNGGMLGPEYVHAQMGSVNGMAVVDYPGNRVFFLTNASSATVYGLDLGPIGTPTLTLATLPITNPRAFTGSNGSAVLRGNRLIFGDSPGQVFALNLVDGASYSNTTGDGGVKGFLWPDRRDDRLYFATNGKVHGWHDTGSSLLPDWTVSVTTPSMVLQKPGTDFVYVGNGNGELVQINVSTQAQTPLLLEGPGVQIGAPSLDGPNNLLIVGSSTGTIHAVRVAVPF